MMIIGVKEQATIKAAIERARKNPIPLDVIAASASAIDQTTDIVTIEERRKADFVRPQSEQILLPTNYRLAISYEEQAAGLCLHLSLSVDEQDRVPGPDAVALVLAACGLDEVPIAARRWWVEEFSIDGRPGGRALNGVFLLEPSEKAAT